MTRFESVHPIFTRESLNLTPKGNSPLVETQPLVKEDINGNSTYNYCVTLVHENETV